MNFTPAQLFDKLAQFPTSRRLWIAYSGGCDSHVLLHAMAQLRPQLAGIEIHALHIDHGLNDSSSQWAIHCRKVCDVLKIPLHTQQVNAQANKGESPEAAARAARYQAFSDILENGDGLLLAQHQDDQAETLLLQLMRGSGPSGLAAMSEFRNYAAGWIGRPLLAFSRQSLCDYAKTSGLHWIDDPSNFDTDFDRNFLRHEIVPKLQQRWPSLTATLARVASHQAEVMQLTRQLALRDWQLTRADNDQQLQIEPFLSLSESEQHNLLRYWIKDINGLMVPDQQRLLRIRKELIPAAEDAQPVIEWLGYQIRRFSGRLYLLKQAKLPVPSPLSWDLQSDLPLANGDILTVKVAVGHGLSVRVKESSDIQVCFRQGGEVCRPVGRGHRHSLKTLMQEWRIPPWRRAHVPLLVVDGEIAEVVGYSVCEPFEAKGDEEGLIISRETVR